MVNWRAVPPCVVTLVGFLVGLRGLVDGSPGLLALSLGFDVLDGRLAREIGGTSKVGADLDWIVDVTLCHAGLVVGGLWFLCPAFGMMQFVVASEFKEFGGMTIFSRKVRQRVSGRAIVFLFLIGKAVLAWSR